jgi:hypothetical protein
MYKIAICGKAKSGKNTLAGMIQNKLPNLSCRHVAFADPVKTIAKIMFPSIPQEYLTGPSEYRNNIVSNAFKDNNPLTVRKLLIDIGTNLGRSYNQDIWVEAFDYNLSSYKEDLIILTDCRFINEFNYLKSKKFFMIKILKNDINFINHVSEIEQDSIPLDKFDLVINNEGSLQDLQNKTDCIINMLQQ